MEVEQYEVRFSGVTDPDKDRTEIANRFAKKARLTSRQVEKIFSTKKPFKIKSGLSEDKARSMASKLNAMGMRVSVVPVESKTDIGSPAFQTPNISSNKPSINKPQPTPAEVSDILSAPSGELELCPIEITETAKAKSIQNNTKHRFSCPKCGLAQTKSDGCVSCGIVFDKMPPSDKIQLSDKVPPAQEDTLKIDHAPKIEEEKSTGYFANLLNSATKGIFGWVASLAVVILLVLKKFGLLKILFIASGLGLAFDSVVEESTSMCLGNQQCEAIVKDSAEDCWDSSGMEKYDWDSMSDTEYDMRYKELEHSFFSCLTYPDGRNLFLKPAYLTVFLADYCSYEENCMRMAGQQQHVCYKTNELDLYANQLTELNWEQITARYGDELQSFFRCFVDDNNQQLFPDDYFEAELTPSE